VAGHLLFSERAPLLRDDLHRFGISILAAHNADFDRKMMGEDFEDYEWICTYKVALHLYPDAASHKNEALCYMLNIGKCGREARNIGQAHSALFDATQTAALLEHFLTKASVEQMIQWTKDVKNITRLPFGKHKGKLWAEVDPGYLVWMVKQADMDADMIELAKREMNRRGYGKK
jgi:exodeoxyribonuclease X